MTVLDLGINSLREINSELQSATEGEFVVDERAPDDAVSRERTVVGYVRDAQALPFAGGDTVSDTPAGSFVSACTC